MGAVTRHLVNAKVDGAFLDCLLLSAEINGTQPSTDHKYVNTISVTSVYLEDYEFGTQLGIARLMNIAPKIKL